MEMAMSMLGTTTVRNIVRVIVFAGASIAAGAAMAQLSSNKGGRETVPGGVEAKPGEEADRSDPKSMPPVGAPAPGAPPRTRGIFGAPSTTPAPAPAPAPSKSVPPMPATPDAKKAGDAKP
jgi:hypothetical protein